MNVYKITAKIHFQKDFVLRMKNTNIFLFTSLNLLESLYDSDSGVNILVMLNYMLLPVIYNSGFTH